GHEDEHGFSNGPAKANHHGRKESWTRRNKHELDQGLPAGGSQRKRPGNQMSWDVGQACLGNTKDNRHDGKAHRKPHYEGIPLVIPESPMGSKPGFIVGSEQERLDRLVQAKTDPNSTDDDRKQDKRFYPRAKATNECGREILTKNCSDCDA